MAKTTASLKAMAKDVKGKKASAPKQSQKPDAPQKTLSTEFVEESEEESDEESDSDNESLPNKVALTSNGKAPAPDGSSSSSETDSDSESEEGSEEEGSTAEESEKDEDVTANGNALKEVAKIQASAVAASNAPTTYKPPPGFELSPVRDATQVSESFKKSQLAGKQIWYFTAPRSVPISTFQNMSLQGVENGDPVLSHDGNDYAFTQDKDEERSYTNIMVPSSDNGYVAVSKPIDQVLHLGKIVKLPGTDSAGISKATVPQKKPVRQQPKGLKMRFLPIGFGEGQAGTLGYSSDSDVEMQEAPKNSKKPAFTNLAVSPNNKVEKASKKPNGTSKRKHGEDTEKKSKKSSSQLTDPPSNKQLKRQKIKQTNTQKELPDKPLISTRPLASNTPIPPPPKITASHHRSQSRS